MFCFQLNVIVEIDNGVFDFLFFGYEFVGIVYLVDIVYVWQGINVVDIEFCFVYVNDVVCKLCCYLCGVVLDSVKLFFQLL